MVGGANGEHGPRAAAAAGVPGAVLATCEAAKWNELDGANAGDEVSCEPLAPVLGVAAALAAAEAAKAAEAANRADEEGENGLWYARALAGRGGNG